MTLRNPKSKIQNPKSALFKTIHDTVHGSIKLGGPFLDALDTPEFQRLHSIRQLGLAHLVFPGANHTRLEHSLGVGHVARRMAAELGLDAGEATVIGMAAQLHDLGHGPFSHTLEQALHDSGGVDHMDLTMGIITGRFEVLGDVKRDRALKDLPRIPEVLERHGLDPKEVAALVREESGGGVTLDRFAGGRWQASSGAKRYPAQIIHGPVDADQLDYLLRDAHYTGVAYGVIDMPRLMQTVAVHGGELVVGRNGVSAVEGMLVARGLMYSSVYYHHTVRIAEVMLSRAVERMEGVDGLEIQRLVDGELEQRLLAAGGYQREVVLLMRYRRLFKRAFGVSIGELDDAKRDALLALTDSRKCREKEDELAARANVPEGHVTIDIPGREILLTEPRLKKTNILVLDGGRLHPLSRYSPLARALQLRAVPDWAVMVCCDAKYRERVGKAARMLWK